MKKIEDVKSRYDFKGKNSIGSRPLISTFAAEDKGHGSSNLEKGLDSRPLISTPTPNTGSQSSSNNPVHIPSPPPPPSEKK